MTNTEKLKLMYSELRTEFNGQQSFGEIKVHPTGYLITLAQGNNGHRREFNRLIPFQSFDGLTEGGIKHIVSMMRDAFAEVDDEGEEDDKTV